MRPKEEKAVFELLKVIKEEGEILSKINKKLLSISELIKKEIKED